MEVKSHLITGPDLQAGLDSKQRAERMVQLQDRRRSLQSLLNTRLAELRQVCLQEAELTGEVPHEYPLETGEKPPLVRRIVGLSRSGSKYNTKNEEEDSSQRKTKKTLFSGALRRHVDSEQHPPHGKRTVHRGCHTDNTVKSENSSTSDSTNQDTEEASDSLSPRLVLGSPDNRFSRKLSPVEIYYEIKTRRNSVTSSASPNHTLTRSVSNLEGRSVPATPLLSRNGITGLHIRSESSGGTAAVKLWSDNPEAPHLVSLQSQEGSSSGSYEQGGGPHSSHTRRSNSSETLLDRNATIAEEGIQRSGMPVRNGPYKSSEAIMDTTLKQAQWSSPDRQVNGHTELSRVRSGVVGRGTNGGVGYSEILMDYVWGKQQKMQVQQQQRLHVQNGAKTCPWTECSNAPPPPYKNGFPHSQQLILGTGPPAYSPLMLRGKPGEPRRVKVTRTKSCGPFVPTQQHQQESIVLSAYTENNTSNANNAVHYQPTDNPHRPPHYPFESSAPTTPDDPTRSLHKALALEGLRDWYLRNAVGQTVNGAKCKEGTQTQRRRTTSSLHNSHPHPPLKHQPQSFQGDTPYPQLPQSAMLHGHPLHGRSVELSSYHDNFSSKMQDMTIKETSNDRPTPGTLV
ncbi:coiled-coil domain-containing protein 120-like isoform X1 [Xyrauchen texanus]|uniref:coiled-coil domain-containing protein 120-like isoform X1 n=1 Tax=Xyrauchen texanus TaxID=154827 RepID=UPI0022422823|nr:coiled-coil domain-containing protein 120-like isoform X1 [Xyrauchen texanus]XP_051951026.1 coiled-coil domain-containing protein 120-like isoform X1 [Xyrauchen texanus]XP_051951027.1 coiled-coil domain-containing protein 120-like isoform X1 [Xyrauchen texanus]XP_051951028.1 coiled-coil domain-containing protein 120-like isoform X1 [Xyrauchen texanus]XP_051951029.1 coiled-coil domain-containing protein 120-like isoform X1 [Xyrauchen texanus]XP_051951031.1 coiled-coil domain-containing prote